MTLAAEDLAATRQARPKSEDASGRGEFSWIDGTIEIRKTGVRLKVDSKLLWEVAHWAIYLAILGPAMAIARLRRRTPVAIWYAPDLPQPWYLVRGAALWAGIRSARRPAQADVAFYFDDATRGVSPSLDGLKVFNGRCTDISKSHVAQVFEDVFGYPLRLDPMRSVGDIVEKAEKNGVHDGRVVQAPLPPREGYAYQRLIDTADDQGLVHDLRTPCVDGVPVVVWDKTKLAGKRFAIHNSRALLRQPCDVFTEQELGNIAAFTARMGLDWGGLDILRGRVDGRIYIVDVNKTDLGPVIALSWADKIRSMNRLSRALSTLLQRAATKAGPPEQGRSQ